MGELTLAPAGPMGGSATKYIYLHNHVIAEAGPAGVQYQHTDALGSPFARSNSTGSLVNQTKYEPYGKTAQGATPTIGFTGHVNDFDTGLVYMQQRYYDPVAGRFLSIDPVTTDANTGGSFNRYVYASNSPFKYIDPDGRADCKPDANGCNHYGNPQKTGTPGHDQASAKVGEAYSKQGAADVHYNRPLSAVTGNPAAGNQRPDVAAVMPDRSVNTTEVVSPSQTVASQKAKGAAMQGPPHSVFILTAPPISGWQHKTSFDRKSN